MLAARQLFSVCENIPPKLAKDFRVQIISVSINRYTKSRFRFDWILWSFVGFGRSFQVNRPCDWAFHCHEGCQDVASKTCTENLWHAATEIGTHPDDRNMLGSDNHYWMATKLDPCSLLSVLQRFHYWTCSHSHRSS